MEKATQRLKTVFRRLNRETSVADDDYVHYEHLRPLSVYSRMIICDDSGKTSLDLNNSSNPFCNFKIEIVNNVATTKRKLDDSCLDDSYETPAKKPFSPPIVSPDLACVLDSYDILPEVDLVSPSTNQNRAEAATSQLDSQHVQSGPHKELGKDEDSAPHSVRPGTESHESQSENAILNLGSAFDFDIEDILCLSPIDSDTDSDEGIDNLVKSFQSPSKPSQRVQNEPVIGQSPERGLGEGDGKEEVREEMERKGEDDGEHDNGTGEEGIKSDEGYFSRHYLEALKAGGNPSQAVNPLPPQPISSPLVNRRTVLQGEEVDAPCPPNSKYQPVVREEYIVISSTVDDCSLTSNGVQMIYFGGDVGEVSWNIGSPIFESSVCNSTTVEPSADGEEGTGEGEVAHPVQECQVSLELEDVTVETSYETTLPLKVQVKSVVVVPTRQAASSKPTVSPKLPVSKSSLPEQISRTTKSAKTTITQRPVVFDKAEDWQRAKRLYVDSIHRHIKENTGAGQDVMTELLTLMTHVSDQGAPANGRQVQHPSDFTRRNYQRRFGNTTPMMSLDEWQTQNNRTYQRFAQVPKIFERSPVP